MSLAKPAGRADAHSVHLHPLRASPTSQTFTKYPLTTRSLLFRTAAVFTVSSAALFHSINPIFTLSASPLTSRAAGRSPVSGSRRSAPAHWKLWVCPSTSSQSKDVKEIKKKKTSLQILNQSVTGGRALKLGSLGGRVTRRGGFTSRRSQSGPGWSRKDASWLDLKSRTITFVQ